MKLYAALALALVLVLGLEVNRARAERYALVIGNNAGEHSEEILRWAERDASRTRELFVELGDVRGENAVLLLGKSAPDVRQAAAELGARIAARRAEHTTLFVYYSGHGDLAALHLGPTSLALAELGELLHRTGATTIVSIIDSCRDEPVRRKGALHAPPFDVRLARHQGPRGRVTITASARNELAQESDQLRGSFFTHHLLSGMRGAADRDGDHRVNLDELYRYAYHHTLATSHARLAAVQHPQLEIELEGEGELVVTQLTRADAVLVLDPSLSGDCLIVEREGGHVIAQLNKSRGAEARIALPAGRFLVQLRDGDSLGAAHIGLEWGGTTTLTASALRSEKLARASPKGAERAPLTGFVAAHASFARAAVTASSAYGFTVVGALEQKAMRVAAQIGSSFSSAENALVARRYSESTFGLSAGPRFVLAPLTLFAGASAGLLWVRERATRLADDGAPAVLAVPVRRHADAIGGYVAAEASCELALRYDMLLRLQGSLPLALVRVDGRLKSALTPAIAIGAGARF